MTDSVVANHWTFRKDDVLIYRPRDCLSEFAGSVCVVRERFAGIEYDTGESLDLGGGVYQVWFPHSESLMYVFEHELNLPGERRWFH